MLVLCVPVVVSDTTVMHAFRVFKCSHTKHCDKLVTVLSTLNMFVQVASAEEFAANVKSAGGSCELYTYEGAGHAFLNDPDSRFPENEKAIYHPANVFLYKHTYIYIYV